MSHHVEMHCLHLLLGVSQVQAAEVQRHGGQDEAVLTSTKAYNGLAKQKIHRGVGSRVRRGEEGHLGSTQKTTSSSSSRQRRPGIYGFDWLSIL
jgi:hypothetical protein